MIKQPECLHIEPLYEGEAIRVDWEAVTSAAGYVVERNFNERFAQTLLGYSWHNQDGLNQTWDEAEQHAFSWQQIEARTGKGQPWEQLDYQQLNWTEIEQRNFPWKLLEDQEISFDIYQGEGSTVLGHEQGRAWTELDAANQPWSDLEVPNQSWYQIEQVTLPGLSWSGVDARWLTFDDWEEQGLTFAELESLSSFGEHRAMTDTIPIGATSAIYRVKAYTADGEESTSLTTDLLPVMPIFYRRTAQEYAVKAGMRYRILLKAQNIDGLERIRMNLRYHPDLLELTNFAAHHPAKVKQAGNYPQQQLTIYSFVPGKVWFQSTKPVSPQERFSGSLTLVEFVAKRTGKATISLS